MKVIGRWILLFFLWTGCTLGAKFSSQCSENVDCPAHAQCVIRGCEGKICLCKDNYMPTDDYTQCIQIAELGERCGAFRRCRGIRSRCDDSGVCRCQSGYAPSDSNTEIPLCKKVLTDGSFALLGRKCDTRSVTCEETETRCVNGSCACNNNFRPAALQEINAYPFNFFQCVKDNFKLNVAVAESDCSLFPTPAHPTPNSHVLTTTDTQPLLSINGLTSEYLLTSVSALASIFTPSQSTFAQTMSSESFESLQNMPSSLSASFGTDAILSSVMPTPSSELQSLTTTPQATSEFQAFETTSATGEFQSFSTRVVSSMDVTTIKANILPSSEFSSSQTPMITPTVSHIQLSSTMSTLPTTHPVMSRQNTVNVISTSYLQSDTSIAPSSTTDETTEVSSLIASTDTSVTLETSESAPDTMTTICTSCSPILTDIYSTAEGRTDSVIISNGIDQSNQMLQTSSTEQLMSSSIVWQFTSSTNHHPSSTISTTPRPPVISTTPTSPVISTRPTPPVISTRPTPPVISTRPTPPVISTRPTMVAIGDTCLRSRQCPLHSTCDPDLCSVNICRCSIGYIVNMEGAECIPLASLGSACTSDAQCIGPNTRCHNHACACQSDYIQSNDKSRCKRDTTWFVSFPLLHEKCKGFFADCYNGVEQVCSAGRCKCRTEQREAALNDIYIKHKSFTQCRNSSTSSGYRPLSGCDGDLLQTASDPNSAEARRKINVMKGAIIGGISGFVALLAIVVAAILLVRHKRRTKIRHIKTDTTSLTSLDRRSSGKYSFRLPRPFAFDLGKEKDWEAEHLSVHNSEFDSVTESDTVLTLKDTDIPPMNGVFSNPVDVSDSTSIDEIR